MSTPVLSTAHLSPREVKTRVDFVALVSRYGVRLRRSGKQYVGLCPFHSERHPSFYIHPERRIFYCFGCSAGGDVFDLVMRAEGCDFPQALKILAGFGVAAGREPRSGERLASGVGAKPLLPAKQAGSHSPETRARDCEWHAWQQRAIREQNGRAARDLATACEPFDPLLEKPG